MYVYVHTLCRYMYKMSVCTLFLASRDFHWVKLVVPLAFYNKLQQATGANYGCMFTKSGGAHFDEVSL